MHNMHRCEILIDLLICVWGWVTRAHLCKLEGRFKCWFSESTICVLGIELNLSGWAAKTLLPEPFSQPSGSLILVTVHEIHLIFMRLKKNHWRSWKGNTWIQNSNIIKRTGSLAWNFWIFMFILFENYHKFSIILKINIFYFILFYQDKCKFQVIPLLCQYYCN